MTLLKFKTSQLEQDFRQLPDPLHSDVLEFALWSVKNGMPCPVVTCLGRDAATNKAVGGVSTSLHLVTEEDPVGRAVDLRDSNYSEGEALRADKWWRNQIMVQQTKLGVAYELVTRAHGTGPHFHIGLKRAKKT